MGTDYLSGVPVFIPGFLLGSRAIFSFLYSVLDHCLTLVSVLLLAIALFVFRFMTSDYPFGIFNLFCIECECECK